MLKEFKLLGFVPAIKPLIDQLRQSHQFPISEKHIQAVLQEVGEE